MQWVTLAFDLAFR